ncbi:MAG: ribose 5-phosphate isomerase B [Myxococcales bacterium]|nr:ribose 5-phosphate isomerase B [Myxococcales bacterium]
MRIAIASDHAAVELRQELAEQLRAAGHEVADLGAELGVRVDYPDYAEQVASRIVDGQADRGVLVCGTGIGMSIAANKIPGIRAALVHDVTTAALAAAHNNANILCLGGRVLGPVTLAECVTAWLTTPFEARHQHRLDKVTALERNNASERGK